MLGTKKWGNKRNWQGVASGSWHLAATQDLCHARYLIKVFFCVPIHTLRIPGGNIDTRSLAQTKIWLSARHWKNNRKNTDTTLETARQASYTSLFFLAIVISTKSYSPLMYLFSLCVRGLTCRPWRKQNFAKGSEEGAEVEKRVFLSREISIELCKCTDAKGV